MDDGVADELAQLAARLQGLTVGLREAADLSANLMAHHPQVRAEVVSYWEQLLGAFYGELQRRGRETGQNLLGQISFARVLRHKS